MVGIRRSSDIMKSDILLSFLLVAIMAVIVKSSAAETGSTSSSILQKRLQNYNKHDPPSLNRPTDVKIGMYVNSITVDTKRMEYSITMYFRQAWQDKRLAFNCTDGSNKCGSTRLHEDVYKNIWTPDTFFRNEKHSSTYSVTVPNQFFKLNKDGSIFSASKLTVTLSCPMALQRFPMDTQRCSLLIESFGYTMDVMYFSHLTNPVEVGSDVQLGEFTLIDTILYDCSQNYTTGAYPCLDYSFMFRRDFGYYLKQVYMPCFFLVVISWLPLWLATDAAARVIIGLFPYFCIACINYFVSTGLLPKVPYITALDIWIGFCQVLILLSLLETTVVLVLIQRSSKSVKIVDSQEKKSNEIVSKVDFFARIGFFAAFVLFIIVYSICYAV